jgi:hypothetical protein
MTLLRARLMSRDIVPVNGTCRVAQVNSGRTFLRIVALALLLPGPGAHAQPAAAPELYVVVLVSAPSTAQRPAVTLPASLRDKSLYWRQLKSGGTTSFQLSLGFFETRAEAGRARQLLASGFRGARVIAVNRVERDNVLKARQTKSPAAVPRAPPPPRPAVPPPPAARPSAAPAARAPVRAPAPAPVSGDDWSLALIAKLGTFKLASASQMVGGAASTYDTSSSPVAGIELEMRRKDGLALGGEFFNYKNKLAANGTTFKGQQAVSAFMLNFKNYFHVEPWFYPYAGFGFGLADSKYGGDLSGSASGLAYQGFAGVDFRFGDVGFHVEYKVLAATTKDGAGEKVKVGGSGILVGASFAF